MKPHPQGWSRNGALLKNVLQNCTRSWARAGLLMIVLWIGVVVMNSLYINTVLSATHLSLINAPGHLYIRGHPVPMIGEVDVDSAMQLERVAAPPGETDDTARHGTKSKVTKKRHAQTQTGRNQHHREERATQLHELSEYVLEDWRACRIIFHLHIAKTGGHSMIKFLQKRVHKAWVIAAFKTWRKSDAQKAMAAVADKLKSYNGENGPLVVSVEVGLPILEELSWPYHNDTCYIAHVREPHSWCQSAINHAARFNSPYTYKDYYSWKNFQTRFLVGLTAAFPGRSVTLIDTFNQDAFYRIFTQLWIDSGLIKEAAWLEHKDASFRDYSFKHDMTYVRSIDWREWASTVLPIDIELYTSMFHRAGNETTHSGEGILHFRFPVHHHNEQRFPTELDDMLRIVSGDVGTVRTDDIDLKRYIETHSSDPKTLAALDCAQDMPWTVCSTVFEMSMSEWQQMVQNERSSKASSSRTMMPHAVSPLRIPPHENGAQEGSSNLRAVAPEDLKLIMAQRESLLNSMAGASIRDND